LLCAIRRLNPITQSNPRDQKSLIKLYENFSSNPTAALWTGLRA
jgi:hypothetical protein